MALLIMTLLIAPGCGYNDIQGLDEETNAAWSEVLNQYQRRADLIPNLVNVVKGYAAHERQTLEAVTQARSQVAGIKATPELIKDPEAFKKFQAAQGDLSTALARLMVVVEKYPDLKANENYKLVRFFPTNMTAKYILKMDVKPNFTVADEKAAAQPPEVKF
ncbi:MAG: LemA family protein [Nitrospirae bacterium]|nr:MAG: LemA family protein [Nitrospirota bacterium]